MLRRQHSLRGAESAECSVCTNHRYVFCHLFEVFDDRTLTVYEKHADAQLFGQHPLGIDNAATPVYFKILLQGVQADTVIRQRDFPGSLKRLINIFTRNFAARLFVFVEHRNSADMQQTLSPSAGSNEINTFPDGFVRNGFGSLHRTAHSVQRQFEVNNFTFAYTARFTFTKSGHHQSAILANLGH